MIGNLVFFLLGLTMGVGIGCFSILLMVKYMMIGKKVVWDKK